MAENREKRCRTCGERKPLDSEHFYSRKDSPTYFGPDCRDCHKVKQNQKYTNDSEYREALNAQRRERRANDPEWREQLNSPRRERYNNDPQYREALNAQRRERRATDPEWREQQNARMRERFHNDPEYKQALNAQRRERRATDSEWREQQNARMRERYRNDPEFREKKNVRLRTREAREKQNTRQRERWATDPEYKTRKLTRQTVKYHSDPDYREKYLARRKTSEYRERNRLWQRNRWKNNPEFRERQSAKQKYKYYNDPEYRERHEVRGLFKRYGITRADREWKKFGQGNVCAICRQDKKLNVDHNHRTGRVRGLLCIGCNGGVGAFSDDVQILVNAIEYLKRPGIAPGDVQPLSAERPFARFDIPYWEGQSRDKKFRKIKNQNLKRSYDINIDQYEGLLEKGNGVCWICLRPETRRRRKKAPYSEALYVDHQHSNGIIRGLLCRTCNTGIGYFDDDPERVAKAIEYLERCDDVDHLAA